MMGYFEGKRKPKKRLRFLMEIVGEDFRTQLRREYYWYRLQLLVKDVHSELDRH